jgi:hypothetical protein
MRPLVIGPPEKAAIERIIAYAMDHIYTIGDPVPGDDSMFVTVIPMGFRCVFSFTRDNHKLYRHLSVSTPDNPGRMPSPEGMVMIAIEFGFTGADPDLGFEKSLIEGKWLFSVDHNHNYIALMQETTL